MTEFEQGDSEDLERGKIDLRYALYQAALIASAQNRG